MKTKNILTIFLVLALAMVGSAFADPITVEDVNVQEVGGDYVVIVSLQNANTSTGIFTELDFQIDGLGSIETENIVVDSTDIETFTFNLADVVDVDDLERGETFRLVVSSDANSDSDTFLFGSERDTDGLGIVIDSIEVSGIEVSDIETLQVLNGELLEVQIKFTAVDNFDDARFRASIDGYEHGIIDDSTEIFQVVAGKTYVKTLSMTLPADMNSEKDYLLRITGANDLSGLLSKDLTLFVDTQRHRVDVLDLVMTPSSGVEPGQNIIANVRLKNRGQKEQDSVRVSVSIPELGIVESSYVSNLNTDEAVTSDDMLIFVPTNAEAKAYAVQVNIAYNDGYTETVESFPLTVLSPRIVPEENLLVSFNNNIELSAGEATSFNVVIANPNDESKPISIVSLDNSWADVDVQPTLHMIKGGDSATYSITITPKGAIEGEKTLTLFVKEGAETVSEVEVQTYVAPSEGINWLNVVLAVLLIIVIIVLLVLVVTIAKRRGDDEEEDDLSSNEEYY